LLVLGGGWLLFLRSNARDAALLRTDGAALPADAQLMSYASQKAAPLYKAHCAGCHGADLTGDRSRGIPDLQDAVWLYGAGKLTDIEQTILYGIRSGTPRRTTWPSCRVWAVSARSPPLKPMM
jgi:mono/diheme cytochrome c family protein